MARQKFFQRVAIWSLALACGGCGLYAQVDSPPSPGSDADASDTSADIQTSDTTPDAETGSSDADASDGGACPEDGSATDDDEICDGEDNDCDGEIDEDTDQILWSEDFEGDNPLRWREVPADHERLEIDDDVKNGEAPQGDEYASARYKTGACASVAGIGASERVDGEVDEITVQINVEIGAWGRAAIFLREANGNTTKIWRANARGDGFSTEGWSKLTFDHSISFETTKSSDAIVEQKTLPSGLGNEDISLIFGNDDDGSNCNYLDHDWVMRLDDLKVIEKCRL